MIAILLISGNAISQEKIFRIEHPPIDEQSALIKSPTYKDVYWVANDSGDGPFIFALDKEGEVIIPTFMHNYFSKDNAEPYPGVEILGAINHDWESMATMGDTIIIADVGNNGNARRDLGVYLVPEPNPYETPKTRALTWLPIHYEDQKKFPPDDWEFDCEAIFTFQGKIYFLSKHRADRNIDKPHPSTNLYVMNTRHSNRSNVLKKVGSRDNLGGWVTGADSAPDGSGIVFIALNPLTATIWYFPRPKKGDDFLSQHPRYFTLLKAQQLEAVCFKDKETILVTNEQREWFEIPLSKFNK